MTNFLRHKTYLGLLLAAALLPTTSRAAGKEGGTVIREVNLYISPTPTGRRSRWSPAAVPFP